jgi:enamine deaminase RidA (YjgF/YER057c/UK114 family)
MRTYRKSVPPRPGYVVAVWRPDGSLITFTAGEPETPTTSRTEADLERQLADAQARIREMIHEIDRRDDLIADLQRRIHELDQDRNSRP